MVGKIYYKELQGSFKAYIKKQNTYCLKCKKPTNNKSNTSKQVINKLHKNQHVLFLVLKSQLLKGRQIQKIIIKTK